MENKINENMVFCTCEGVKTRKEDFGLLVVSKTTPALSLNDDAMSVWTLCNGMNTVSDIIASIKETYKRDDVDKLVMDTLDNFLKLCLIMQRN